jgi:tetratricopeptide (TPR) repeat protein
MMSFASRPRGVSASFEQALRLHQQGRPADAEACCREALDAEPHDFASRHLLGLICSQRGDDGAAIEHLDRALAVNPNVAFAHFNRGIVLQTLQRFAEAMASYDRAIALKPDYAEAFCNRGNVLSAVKRLEEALASYDQALVLKPDFARALVNRGVVLDELGRHGLAQGSLEQAIALEPDFAEAHYNLGNVLRRQDKLNAAVAHYERALAIMPQFAEAHCNLGVALDALGRQEAAVAHYEQALANMPQFAEAHFNLANTLRGQGRHEAAITHYERALALRPDFAEAHCNLGVAFKEEGRLEHAAARLRQAIAIRPEEAEPYHNLAAVLIDLGELSPARSAAERAIELQPRRPANYYTWGQISRWTAGDPRLGAMEGLVRELPSLAPPERVKLHFALGKAYEDIGRHRRAFAHLLAGNALKRHACGYDEAATLGSFQRIRDTFTSEMLSAKRGIGEPSRLPVFIIGMPRSGTTLAEQILASHPHIFGAGECHDLPRLAAGLGGACGVAGFPEGIAALSAASLRQLGRDYLDGLKARAPQARRITDKMLANFSLVGFIHLLLPGARIIHIRRDPVDTCVSCFSTLFTAGHPYAYDLAELGRYYRAYAALMEHWGKALPAGVMLEIQYEQLVSDLKVEAQRMIAHCGLRWSDRCVDFHHTKRAVSTASAAQVRRPLYASSVGRWRAYQETLQPLLGALAAEPEAALETIEGAHR